MKKILLVCIYNFYQWKGNVRVVCTFLLLLGYLFSILRPIREFCALVQEPCTPWVFPFITSEPTCVMLLMLLFILLLCDIPFLYPDQKYVLFRAGKKHWICGQVLYAGMVSFLFWVTVLIGSVLSLLPQLTASHQWGKVLYTLSQTAQVGDIFFFFAIDYKLIVGFSPVQACLIAFLLAWLVSFWLAELMLFLNMWGIKSLGIMFGLFSFYFRILLNLPVDIGYTNCLPFLGCP